MFKLLKKQYTKFNAWIRYNPPTALTTRGWRLFEEEFRQRAPIRYYLYRGFRNKYVRPIYRKYLNILDWIRYRTYDRYHILHTRLPPGYHEVDTQMLHVNFNLLKDFVEIELAWHYYIWHEEDRRSWFEKYIPFYDRFFPSLNPNLGINYLNWATTLDDPMLPPVERSERQAQSAREILALYNWWVNDRPNRKEIVVPDYDHQGLGIMASLDDDFDREASDYKEHHKKMKERSEQEEKWRKEDDEMLIRLMNVRRDLWT